MIFYLLIRLKNRLYRLFQNRYAPPPSSHRFQPPRMSNFGRFLDTVGWLIGYLTLLWLLLILPLLTG